MAPQEDEPVHGRGPVTTDAGGYGGDGGCGPIRDDASSIRRARRRRLGMVASAQCRGARPSLSCQARLMPWVIRSAIIAMNAMPIPATMPTPKSPSPSPM